MPVVEFKFEHADECVLVEVEQLSKSGIKRTSGGDKSLEVASRSFEAAIGSLVPVAKSFTSRLKELGPSTGEIEFGFKVTADSGIIISHIGGEAHCKVTLSWDKHA